MSGDTEWKKSRKAPEGVLHEIARWWQTICKKLARKKFQTKFHKKVQLPNPEDITKLGEYLSTKLKVNPESLTTQVSYVEYKYLVELVQAKLLTYNNRRRGETEDIA